MGFVGRMELVGKMMKKKRKMDLGGQLGGQFRRTKWVKNGCDSGGGNDIIFVKNGGFWCDTPPHKYIFFLRCTLL